MAKNDRLLLDGIIDDRVAMKLPSEKRDEAFEYLAFEQVMKDFDLSMDELLSGFIDGRQDGSIDGFFIVVNGHLLQDPESFMWPRTGSDPPQPWKPGLHKRIAAQLTCSAAEYFAGVERLIDDGVFLRQKDGVLYDNDGNVVSFDVDRVDPDTLELRAAVT